MSCDACRAQVKRETLQFTNQGQALCQQCYGTYLSKVAALDAQTHEVYRRCTCGTMLAPMGDTSVTPYVEGDRGHLDLGFFFQPRKYECGSCGTRFGVQHIVTVALLIAIFGGFSCAWLYDSGDEVVGWLVMLASFVGVIGYDVYLRIRYPRVISIR